MMQIRKFLILILALFQITVYGQVTVTNAVFPEIGDVWYEAGDPSGAGINLGNPSASAQNWDFTSFQPNFIDTVEVFDPADGSAAATFPSADLLVPQMAGESYLDVDQNQVRLLGFSGGDGFGGVNLGNLALTYSPSQVLLEAPFEYGDSFTDDSGFLISVATADVPGLDSLLPAFPPIDSIRVNYTSSRTDAVDAFGTMSTHLGDFDVLRMKRVDFTNTAIEFLSFGFWIDPTSIGVEIPIGGPDTLYTYDFISATEKSPIVSVGVQSDDMTIQNATYLTSPSLVVANEALIRDEIFTVFPNPAVNNLKVKLDQLEPGTYHVLIYSLFGKLVQKDWFKVSGSEVFNMDVSDLNAGTHLIRLQTEEGQSLVTKRFLVIRP